MSKSPRNGFRACAGGRPRRSSAGADSGASGRPPRSREQSPRAGAGQSPPGGTADPRTPSGPSSDSSQSPRTGRAAGGGRHLRREPRGDSAGVALLASSDFWTTPGIAPPCAPGAVLAASGSLLGVGNRVRERVRQRAEGPSPPSIGARRRQRRTVRGTARGIPWIGAETPPREPGRRPLSHHVSASRRRAEGRSPPSIGARTPPRRTARQPPRTHRPAERGARPGGPGAACSDSERGSRKKVQVRSGRRERAPPLIGARGPANPTATPPLPPPPSSGAEVEPRKSAQSRWHSSECPVFGRFLGSMGAPPKKDLF